MKDCVKVLKKEMNENDEVVVSEKNRLGVSVVLTRLKQMIDEKEITVEELNAELAKAKGE
jgi:hypothetical protein